MLKTEFFTRRDWVIIGVFIAVFGGLLFGGLAWLVASAPPAPPSG